MSSLVPSPSRKSALERATTQYHNEIAGAEEYLRSRGITEEIAAAARLGYVSVPAEEAHEFALGRIAIPYLTHAGVVGMKFRCVTHYDCKAEGCTKYLGEEGFHPRLYGVTSLLEKSDFVVITEGEIDALSVRYLADIPAVGAPGASTWKPFWSRLFAGYSDVVVVADGDEAGSTFARTIVEGSSQRSIPALENARIVRLPEGTDANNLIVTEGVAAFRKRIGL